MKLPIWRPSPIPLQDYASNAARKDTGHEPAQAQDLLQDHVHSAIKKATRTPTALSTREWLSHPLSCPHRSQQHCYLHLQVHLWAIGWFTIRDDWWGSGSTAPTKVTLRTPILTGYFRLNIFFPYQHGGSILCDTWIFRPMFSVTYFHCRDWWEANTTSVAGPYSLQFQDLFFKHSFLVISTCPVSLSGRNLLQKLNFSYTFTFQSPHTSTPVPMFFHSCASSSLLPRWSSSLGRLQTRMCHSCCPSFNLSQG